MYGIVDNRSRDFSKIKRIIDATGVSVDINVVGADIPVGKRVVAIPGGVILTIK